MQVKISELKWNIVKKQTRKGFLPLNKNNYKTDAWPCLFSSLVLHDIHKRQAKHLWRKYNFEKHVVYRYLHFFFRKQIEQIVCRILLLHRSFQ